MPNGVYPVPRRRPDRRTPDARKRLDRALADGADPGSSGELNMRARELLSPAVRARTADALVQILADAHRPVPVSIRARPQRAEVLACADELLALVARLRDERPIAVPGAAMAILLVARSGPLRRAGSEDLSTVIRATRVALDGSVSHELAAAA